jgi:sec-independent protein translocase protein TatC
MASASEERMPLIDHLRELRKRVLKSAVAVLVVFVGGWYLYNPIIATLAKPVCDLKAAQQSGAASCGALYISGVLGPLDLQIKVALLTGVIVSAPFWLYQLWAFIAPALHRKEKRTTVLFVCAATPFFALGATLGYFILPIAIKALFGFTPNSISNLVRFDDYLDFVLRVILFVGLAFELPIFLLTFNLIGFLRGKTILKPWRVWVFAIFLAVAALSPTADPLSMVLLAAPLIVFYFMAGGIAVLVDKKRDKRSASLETGISPIEKPAPITE